MSDISKPFILAPIIKSTISNTAFLIENSRYLTEMQICELEEAYNNLSSIMRIPIKEAQ